MNQQTKWQQFSVLISVFFFWGFVAASNDILIPVFKEKLNLSQTQSQMISFAFYVAYFAAQRNNYKHRAYYVNNGKQGKEYGDNLVDIKHRFWLLRYVIGY